MNLYSTRQAAKKLGIPHNTLTQYLAAGKLPLPKGIIPGIRPTHAWTEEEIEHVRQLLPKIANGRKTRYQKLREKKKDAPAGVPVPQKQSKPKQRKPKKK